VGAQHFCPHGKYPPIALRNIICGSNERLHLFIYEAVEHKAGYDKHELTEVVFENRGFAIDKFLNNYHM
jgi:hypothetical protein